ncbi:hypothetical protein GGI15_003851 [Coemansia interrupta]|uniref:YhhN-like protein n=1 Tax=Coemansia interrupta TaxID=1126814 RepID=A0A9W8HD03_9FUNG|nr:hypothetical protein GGI15_003851 [Coemansia interrupta]
MSNSTRFSPYHLLAVVLGSIYMVAIARQWQAAKYALKPAVTLLIAAPMSKPESRRIFHGLLFSALGDIFLMLPRDDMFLPGLLAFLAAHVLYAKEFGATAKSLGRQGRVSWTAIPYGVFASTMVAVLMPGAGREGVVVQAGVVVYAVAIAVMAYRATLTGRSAAVLGTILFCVSDSILAWDKFQQPQEWSELGVMSTYYAAQLCIALAYV